MNRARVEFLAGSRFPRNEDVGVALRDHRNAAQLVQKDGTLAEYFLAAKLRAVEDSCPRSVLRQLDRLQGARQHFRGAQRRINKIGGAVLEQLHYLIGLAIFEHDDEGNVVGDLVRGFQQRHCLRERVGNDGEEHVRIEALNQLLQFAIRNRWATIFQRVDLDCEASFEYRFELASAVGGAEQ